MLIKKFPEDFVVEEVPVEFSGVGDYAVYKLKKKDFNTESAVEYICKRFSIQRKNVKYAGSKDRHAITTQYISIFKDLGKLFLSTDNLHLEFVSFHNAPLSLGSLNGNKFIIRIRELNNAELRKAHDISESFIFPNYFDDQRFSDNNYAIGLALLKKDFKQACTILKLEAANNNYVSAIKTIPQKTLLFYIHAVQAYIFNNELSEHVKKQGNVLIKHYSLGELSFSDYYDERITIKLVGFDSDSPALKELGLSTRDFIIRQFPELSVEGVERKCFISTTIKSRVENNEVVLEFSLPKGSYATMMIKALF
ncbi:MAG: tRNA pseudouridine(13) synthase TruD [Candidatus Woesearchaeota archaeon]